MKKSKGFTLIELLIVIAIIGILAAVALPFYEGHRVTAKLSEVENAMAMVATAAIGYYELQNSWPDCPDIPALATSLGVGVGALSRVNTLSISPVNGTITCIVQNIHSMVDGKTLTLTPTTMGDNSITWEWGSSADFPPQYKPKGGR